MRAQHALRASLLGCPQKGHSSPSVQKRMSPKDSMWGYRGHRAGGREGMRRGKDTTVESEPQRLDHRDFLDPR